MSAPANPLTLSIKGMSCGGCVQTVTRVLASVPGVKVKSVAVGSAVIETADDWTTGKAIAAVEEAGYSAKAVGNATGLAAPMQGGGDSCKGTMHSTSAAAERPKPPAAAAGERVVKR